MAMSMSAGLAWGIDLGTAEDGSLLDTSSADFEQTVMASLFGFTEERPASTLPNSATSDERLAWRKEFREPWERRLSAAVPLALRSHGYESEGTALVLKRSLTEIGLGAQAVDLAALAAPSPDEVAAFGVVLDRIGYDGDRTLRLLLLSHHG